MQKQFLIAVILVALLSASAHAVSQHRGHITLLTVSEDPEGTGGTADLYLDIRPGTGAIFIDSFPLTRIDTQGSTRYANQIACDFLQVDCSQYDFFYTIRANSAIVGGPSAGGAMTVLTVAMLDGQDIDQSVAMTGTINSGGIIGPVAGIPQKVAGAKRAGITKVLIPALVDDYTDGRGENATGNVSIAHNTTVSGVRGMVPELSDTHITVIRIGTVEEALEQFTGKNYSRALPPLAEPPEYTVRMHAVASEICNRTTLLRAQIAERNISYNDTGNFTARIAALPPSHEYSRASLCFSANVDLNSAVLGNETPSERAALYGSLRADLAQLETALRAHSIGTISDLEVYAIVKERLVEAHTILDAMNGTNATNTSLAYAQERIVSAKSWEAFFGMPGKEFRFDDQYLRKACLSKISEADERINYVRIYSPSLVEESEKTLGKAYGYAPTEPILCIFTASQAKAQANLIASVIAIDSNAVDPLISEKLHADTLVLQKQQEEGMFPLLGYSYMTYAGDLRHNAPYSALLFSEYSLELSNLDMYFPAKQAWRIPSWIVDGMQIFLFGAIFGAAAATLVLRRKNIFKTASKKKKKR